MGCRGRALRIRRSGRVVQGSAGAGAIAPLHRSLLGALPPLAAMALALLPAPLHAQTASPARTPFVDSATGVVHSRRLSSGVPLGGVGAGTFQLMTDGTISRATITNNWSAPTGDLPGCFAAIWTRAGGRADARVLALKSGYHLPTVAGADFDGLYPKARLSCQDPALPVQVTLSAFSPLVPDDIENSIIPGAVVLVRVRNRLAVDVDVSLALSWENVLGVGGSAEGGPFRNRTGDRAVTIPSGEGYFGMEFTGPPSAPAGVSNVERMRDNATGDMALMTLPPHPLAVTTTAGWNALDARPAWWDRFALDGTAAGEAPMGAEGSVHPSGVVAVRMTLPPNGFAEVPFAVAWNTPHAYTLSGADQGHYYEKLFPSSIATARKLLSEYQGLLALTEEWQERILFANLPSWLARRIINSTSPLTTHTIYTREGRFAFLANVGIPVESSAEDAGRSGSLVSLPERMSVNTLLLAFFPQLDSQELLEFSSMQDPDGGIPASLGAVSRGIPAPAPPSGVGQPLGPSLPAPADADAMCAYVLQMAQYVLWTGDGSFAVEHFRHARRAMQYLLQHRDGNGVPAVPGRAEAAVGRRIERRATPASTAILWLAALRASQRLAELTAARALSQPRIEVSHDELTAGLHAVADTLAERGDDLRFSAECRTAFDHAAPLVADAYWNGRFFTEETDPAQAGCRVNQLMGQLGADVLKLGSLQEPTRIVAALHSLSTLNDRRAAACGPVFRAGGPADAGAALCSPWESTLYDAILSIYQDEPEAGVGLMERLDGMRNEILHSPWEASDWVDGASLRSEAPGLSSVTGAADWSAQYALQGFAQDADAGELALKPHIPGTWRTLRSPIFAPGFWGRLVYKPLARGYLLTLLIDRLIPYSARPTLRSRNNATLVLSTLRVPSSGASSEIHVSRGRNPLGFRASPGAAGDLILTLDSPLSLAAGDRVEIEVHE